MDLRSTGNTGNHQELAGIVAAFSHGVPINHPPICATCAQWKVYPFILAGRPTEGWRCFAGVTFDPKRRECAMYLRESGSEPW